MPSLFILSIVQKSQSSLETIIDMIVPSSIGEESSTLQSATIQNHNNNNPTETVRTFHEILSSQLESSFSRLHIYQKQVPKQSISSTTPSSTSSSLSSIKSKLSNLVFNKNDDSLTKRAWEDCNVFGYCRSSNWYYWGRWILLGLIIFIFIVSLLLIYTSSRKRVRVGKTPIYGTGWMMPPTYQQSQQTYGMNGYQQQPPPPPPQYQPREGGVEHYNNGPNSSSGMYGGGYDNNNYGQGATSSYGAPPPFPPPQPAVVKQ